MVKYGNLDLIADIYVSNSNWNEEKLDSMLEENGEMIYKKIKPLVNEAELLEGTVEDHELKYKFRILLDAKRNVLSSSWDFDGKTQEEYDLEYPDIEGEIQKALSSAENVQIDILSREFVK